MKIRMLFKETRVFALLAGFLCCSFPVYAVSDCDSNLPMTAVHDDVLILVNDNSLDSCEVAKHYAEQRSVGKNNIAHVSVPAVNAMDWQEFRSMMDQIIAKMQSPELLAMGAPQAPVCAEGSVSPFYCAETMAHLRAYTKIRYLVTTRGIPALTSMAPSIFITQSPTSLTSVDNHLKYWLVRYFSDTDNNGETDARKLAFYEREYAFGDGRGMRLVDVVNDGELIVGRIDGVNLDAAKRLVDRAINAEAQGIYGTLYSDRFENNPYPGKMQWLKHLKPNYKSTDSVYAEPLEAWRYQLGIFGESRSVCVDDLKYNVSGGQAPLDCTVKFGNDSAGGLGVPGQTGSRTEAGLDALVYFGELLGHASGGSQNGFNTILNTVKSDAACTPRLCKDHQDPALCRTNSTDALHEINTSCVGVSDGFIGFNYQSYPVSNFSLWPTGWEALNALNHVVPVVRNDSGQGASDTQSLWLAQHDSVPSPKCYDSTTNSFSTAPVNGCRQSFNGTLSQNIYLDNMVIVNESNPPAYTLSFWYRFNEALALTNNKIRIGIEYFDGNSGSPRVTQTVETFSNSTDWKAVDPYEFTVPADVIQFDRIRIMVQALGNGLGSRFSGELGFDNFSLKRNGDSSELIRNPSFDEGHEQTSMGDHAAMYLSRLNGTAFWGSVSHYESGGHSFGTNPLETLIYFMRGLPLGDAVWWGEERNSGIFYGDPLYSPIAVRLIPVNPYDFISVDASVELTGDVVNGYDLSFVNTQYQLAVCSGNDFYTCDQNASWTDLNISGSGGAKGTSLGNWNTENYATGIYTLRLGVTSTNPSLGKAQTFYDYSQVVLYEPTADNDGDGLDNQSELETYSTDPTEADSDGDQISDGDEVNTYNTQPNNVDSDGDGVTDYHEITLYHTNPLASDTDGDGISDQEEIANGSDPNAIPVVVEIVTSDMMDTAY